MNDIWSKIKYFLTMTFAVLIMAVGIYFFKFTNNFTFGGITGLAVLVTKFTVMSASDFNLIANVILLIIGALILGKKFGAASTYCTLLLSVSLWVLERVYPMSHPLTNQPLLEFVFALALPSVGSAILFNIGASSGGTDIVAMTLKKYTSINIGNALLVTDFFITVATFFVFDITTGLFAIMGLFLRSTLIDNFIESLNLSKYCTVITSNPRPIAEFIKDELHRGATVVLGQGAFSGNDRYLVMTALNRGQAIKLRNFVKLHDPKAFITITNTSEIIGKGFHSV